MRYIPFGSYGVGYMVWLAAVGEGFGDTPFGDAPWGDQ